MSEVSDDPRFLPALRRKHHRRLGLQGFPQLVDRLDLNLDKPCLASYGARARKAVKVQQELRIHMK